MSRFVAFNRRGQAIAILEAASHGDADLYGLRKLPNYRRVEAIADDYEGAADASLKESFSALGLSSAAAAIAAQGRASQETALPVITVPFQEASPAFRRPGSASSSAGGLQAAIARGDAASVQRLALQGSRARSTRSSEQMPTAEAAAQVAVDLTETFQELGLSSAAAAMAATGRE